MMILLRNSKHIVNLDQAIQSSNLLVLNKYLNNVRLKLPYITESDWESIINRKSSLYYFLDENVRQVIEVMTFVKNPLNCMSDGELASYVNTLRTLLNDRNEISLDEYIYVLRNKNCTEKFSFFPMLNDVITSSINAIPHGILRGFSKSITEVSSLNGISQRLSFCFGNLIYYVGYLRMKFSENCSKPEFINEEKNYINAFYQAVIETGQILILNIGLCLLNSLVEFAKKRVKNTPWLSAGLSLCNSIIPVSIFAKNASNNGIVSVGSSLIAGTITENVTNVVVAKGVSCLRRYKSSL